MCSSDLPLGMDDWVRVRLGMVGGAMVATPLPRGAGVLTSLVRADGLLVVPLWALLHSDRFQAAVTELGGYSTKEMGRRVR